MNCPSIKFAILVLVTVVCATLIFFSTYSHAYPQGPFTWAVISPSSQIVDSGHIDFNNYDFDKLGSFVRSTSQYYFVSSYLTAIVSILTGLSVETVMMLPLLYLFSGIIFYVLAVKLIGNSKYAYFALILFLFGDAWCLVSSRVDYTFSIGFFIILCLVTCFYNFFNKYSDKNILVILLLMSSLIFSYYSLSFYFLFLIVMFFIVKIIFPSIIRRNDIWPSWKKNSFVILFILFLLSIIFYTILLSPIVNDVVFVIGNKPSPLVTVPSTQWLAIRSFIIVHMVIMVLASIPAFIYAAYYLFKKKYAVSIFFIFALGLGAGLFFTVMYSQAYFGTRGFFYSFFIMVLLSILSFKFAIQYIQKLRNLHPRYSSIKHLKRLISILLIVFIAANIGIVTQAYPTLQNMDVYCITETVAGASFVNKTSGNLTLIATMDYSSILYGTYDFNDFVFLTESQNQTLDVSQQLFWPEQKSNLTQVMAKYDFDALVIDLRANQYGFRLGREFRDPISLTTISYYEDLMNVGYTNGYTFVYVK